MCVGGSKVLRQSRGLANKNIKEARMKPLTYKPFINLAEAIALAKETGKPVLVKP